MMHRQLAGHMRPYGIAKNPTMTSTLVVSCFLYFRMHLFRRKTRWLLFVLVLSVIILLRSGTGIILFVFAIVIFSRSSFGLKILGIVLLIALVFLVIALVYNDIFYYLRVTPEYIGFLLQFKLEQAFVGLVPKDYSFINVIFGAPEQTGFTNDIGWIPFFYAFGLGGCVVYLLVLVRHMGRSTKGPIIILLLGALHYPAIFSIPGQMLFAFLLSERKRANYISYS